MLGFLLTPGQTRLFTNRWAVKITGGPEAADFIAEKYGFLNMGQVCKIDLSCLKLSLVLNEGVHCLKCACLVNKIAMILSFNLNLNKNE